MRRHHLTCVATAGRVGSWVNAGNTFLEIHPKQLAERCYLIVVLNTVITSVSQILREKKKTMNLGAGDYFMSVDGLKVEEINL